MKKSMQRIDTLAVRLASAPRWPAKVERGKGKQNHSRLFTFVPAQRRKGDSMKKFSLLKTAGTAFAFWIAASIASPAQTTFKTVNFNGSIGGASPYFTSLIQGTNGNIYGTAPGGGTYDNGTIFQMTPAGVLTNVYSFCFRTNCLDGSGPQGALVESGGDLYGTTYGGGAHLFGTVFKTTLAGKMTTLHSFAGTTDGAYPEAGLVSYNGDFYGTTTRGGAHGGGAVFEITPGGKVTTLYSFCSLTDCADGADPTGGLIQVGGNFYGTTSSSGANGNGGTVFEITPEGTLTTLYSFCSQTKCTDGASPYGSGLIQVGGNYYGATAYGGAKNGGTVLELTPGGMLTTLYTFCSQTNCTDGAIPYGGIIQATDGNFYGTTCCGGANNGGTVFKLTPGGTLTTLQSFNGTQGEEPYGGLLQAGNGDFYGTAEYGGSRLLGIVFKLSVKD
jgi:uncharacterized repeat protein (TIGR03803 family)